MKIHALGTHSDWVYSGGAWGRPGLQRIADLILEAGLHRLYWRTHNGGQAMYPSQVGTIQDGSTFRNYQGLGTLPRAHFRYAEMIDYRQWDQVADMAETGRAAGLSVCHWYTVFEDDHGGAVKSRFLENHPEFQCVRRDGEKVPGCLEFWFPEVQQYKLTILDELLQKPTDRFLLDFVRRNGTPSADADGFYRYGFNAPLRQAFTKQTGLDARGLQPGGPEWRRWLDYLTAPLTDFLREAARRIKARNLPLDLMVWPVELKTWMAFDLPRLASEGLIDSILIGSHRYACSAAEVRRQLDALRPQVQGTSVRLVPGLPGYGGLTPAAVDHFCEEAERQKVEEIVFYESNSVIKERVGDRLRAVYFGVPYYRRAVSVPRVAAVGDWTAIPVHQGFLKTFQLDNLRADQETRLQLAHDGRALHLRVTCLERDPSQLVPVPCFDRSNYNVRQLRARMFWDPYESVHLFLDPEHRHDDYHHFLLDPANAALEERFMDEDWTGAWEHRTEIGADRWCATLCIPFATLGLAYRPGLILGWQAVRVQNHPREVTAWFCAQGWHMHPDDLGHLTLE